MIQKSWTPDVIATADGKFQPAVKEFSDGEYNHSIVYEYDLYDMRDAWILANHLAKSTRMMYAQSVNNELDRMRSRVRR